MTEPTTSRILRTPPGTRGGLSDVVSAKTKPIDPLETAVSALVFVAALFTLGYFAIVNWSNGVATRSAAAPPVELTEAERSALELDRAKAEAARPATLDDFYGGDFGSDSDPFLAFRAPVMSEDGSGPLPVTNAYGSPSVQLFSADTGGWGVPFAPPAQTPAQTGLQ